MSMASERWISDSTPISQNSRNAPTRTSHNPSMAGGFAPTFPQAPSKKPPMPPAAPIAASTAVTITEIVAVTLP